MYPIPSMFHTELNKPPSVASLVESIKRLDIEGQVHVFMSCFRTTLLGHHEDGSVRLLFDVKENDLVCVGGGNIYSEQELNSLVGYAFKKRGMFFLILWFYIIYFGSYNVIY